MGLVEEEALSPTRTVCHAPRLIKKLQSFKIRLKNRGYLYEGFEKRISGVIFCGRESILENNRRTQKKIYITFCDTISSSFAKPEEQTDEEMTPQKLTLIITSHRKIVKRYPYNS